ncbi:MAG: prepilin-type N-terminal cleavage/methylation domain-containing protein [Candidatus Omnitrophica bacterium]|nr:prepilin-type N-terminal cleavage/methylation domain-containing protein [Candidatus Omnitrophota bacterium]
MDREKKSLTGFTLVEIMIVVGVIVVLAAIAIPGILRSRMNANEAAAIASVKTISWATTTYRAGNPAYPANLSDLATSSPAYVDSVLGSGTKQGYNFALAGGANTFNVTAAPATANVTGVRTFFVDESGVIRGSSNGTADVTSLPI